MNKTRVQIAVGGQNVEAFFYRKDGAPRPGVLVLTDIKGVRDVYHAQAARIAEAGFAVLLPNVFFRGGEAPLFRFPFVPGEERTVKRLQELYLTLTPAMQLADSASYVDFLSAQDGVSAGPMGVVGYCFTGAMALRMASVRPERIRAAASFHGGKLYTEDAESPHRVLPKVKAALHFGHAEGDALMPLESIRKLDEALCAWGGKFVSGIYPGAQHGWTNSDSPIYNQAQAEKAFDDMLALFRAALL